jgi:hypothetical protein
MPKIGVYSRIEFCIGTARLLEDSENFTIVADDRKGQLVTLEIHHRHDMPHVEAKRKAKSLAQLAQFNLKAA